jgi:hypothetical protein
MNMLIFAFADGALLAVSKDYYRISVLGVNGTEVVGSLQYQYA